MRRTKLITGLFAGVAMAGAAHAATPFLVTYEPEAPKATTSSTSATFKISGVENFETISTFNGTSDVSTPLQQSYSANFTTDYGTGGQITGKYTNVQLNNADQYGGAGGAGQYPVAFSSNPYTLTLTSVPGVSANYFGYWLSALDGGNTLTFSEKGKVVYTFSAQDALNVVSKLPDASAYYGNPDYYGNDSGEPFVFLNFFDKTGSFDQITFSESPNAGGGYESDNHTVGFDVINYGNGVPIPSAVPEPATWALMIVGVGAVGAVLRRRRAGVLLKTA